MYPSVGVNQTVHAEVAVIGEVAEVAAVGEAGARILVVPDGYAVVGKFPDTAAEEGIVCPDHIPVCRQIPGAVAHGVAVFTQEQRLDLALILAVFVAPAGSGIHPAFHIGGIGLMFAPVVPGVGAFVVYQTAGVPALDPLGHGGVVSAQTRFVAQRPEDYAGMVLVPFHQALGSVHIGLFPVGMVGEAVPGMHAVGFDVGFVTYIQTELVAQAREPGIVGIVGGTDHIDVVGLHNHQIPDHVVHGGGVAQQVVAVVTVDALGLDFLPVDIDDLILDFDPSCTGVYGDGFVPAGQNQGVQIGGFVRPQLGIFDGGNGDDAFCVDGFTAGSHAAAAGRQQFPVHRGLAGEGQFCRKVCRIEAVVQVTLHEDVPDVGLVPEQQVYFSEDPGHTPHILVFQIGTVGPFQYQHLDGVDAGMDKPGDVDFAGQVAYLGIGRKGVVDPYIERRVHPFKVQENFLAHHGLGHIEIPDVQTAGVFVRYMGRIHGNGVVHVGVVGYVIPPVQRHLPVHGHRELFHGGTVEAAAGEVADVVYGLEEFEIPHAAEGFEIGAGITVFTESSAFAGVGDKVRTGGFAVYVQDLFRDMVIGNVQRHNTVSFGWYWF